MVSVPATCYLYASYFMQTLYVDASQPRLLWLAAKMRMQAVNLDGYHFQKLHKSIS